MVDEQEKQLARQLDDSESDALIRIESWLRGVGRQIPFPPTREVYKWQPVENPPLNQILTSHALGVFALGRRHGRQLAALARASKSKLAGYDLPQFVFDYDQDPQVIPEYAIRQLSARQLVLAGEVQQDVLAAIKKALIAHLAGQSRQATEQAVADILSSTRQRASLIITTETTYAYNRGRLVSFREASVDYVRFSAVMDARTSPQCRSRHGLVMALDDPRLAANTPPLHGRCRSILTPLYSDIQAEYITPATTDWSRVTPLPRGWRNE